MSARALTDAGLAAAPGVAHGFFTRRGGVSAGVYGSLNCGLGSGDAGAAVAENRARAMAALRLGPEALVTGYQVHGIEVRIIDGNETAGERRARRHTDAAVTSAPGIALGVLTADCAPVLLADPEARVIGAAHAGWRGALAGVVEATVAAMERLGASRGAIVAAIGPCIAAESYEVGPEFPAPFLADDAASARFFAPRRSGGRLSFDLAGYLAWRLGRLGLGEVGATGGDTCADDAAFFSYRRAYRRGETDYGRLLSAIALES
ncbi:MAG TPA: peptidoglycan editing factor PgeF [Alphaproteobacteria bacterium]